MRTSLMRASIGLRIAGALLVLEWGLREMLDAPLFPISLPPYVGLAVYLLGDVLRLMDHARRLRAPRPPAAVQDETEHDES